MGKGEFIDAVATKANVSKKEASNVYEAIVQVITEELVAGNRISLVGFGNFEVKHRAARKGVNPSTKEEIDIPAKDVPKFSFSSNIRKAISE
ncbi:MAG: HU family DNA-binding protein [Bacilli bacterium]|nr:HU family DNA-binding protein [Bacilli bacterium]MBQ3307566.1 HU family DNA-binding protein [Bacilli bacterium]